MIVCIISNVLDQAVYPASLSAFQFRWLHLPLSVCVGLHIGRNIREVYSYRPAVIVPLPESQWIKVDNSAIEVAEASCFADAVELLLATFYVFNVDYPHHLKPTYEIFETLLNIRKTPKTSLARGLLRTISDSRIASLQPWFYVLCSPRFWVLWHTNIIIWVEPCLVNKHAFYVFMVLVLVVHNNVDDLY